MYPTSPTVLCNHTPGCKPLALSDQTVGAMESSDEEEGHTFVQVVSEKYNPENFPYCRGNGMGVVVLSSPQGSPIKGQRSRCYRSVSYAAFKCSSQVGNTRFRLDNNQFRVGMLEIILH